MTETINEILTAIRTMVIPDVTSMQLYDVQTLLVKQSKQMRELAGILIDSGKLTIRIDASTTSIDIADKHIADVAVVGNNIECTINRTVIMNAIVTSSTGSTIEHKVSGQTITIVGAALYEYIDLTFI